MSVAIALHIQDVCKSYGQLNAEGGVSLLANAGETVGLRGPNGAGGSTLNRCIAGLLRATCGLLDVEGLNVRTSEAQTRTGYIPEVPVLYDLFTPWKHLQSMKDWSDSGEGPRTPQARLH